VTDEPAVVADQLRVVRGGRVALDRLSVTIRPGCVTGLLGPSGSGKSTLMRAIVGVQILTGGRVVVLGQEAGSPPLRRRVGYMTQAPSVYVDLTVRENLRYFGRVLKVEPPRVEDVIEVVGLEADADRVVDRLSGGQRTRVSLAAALVGNPELLVLDEPTVGLDPLLRRDLWSAFTELAKQGATLLVSSHVMDEAQRCNDLLLLSDGRLLFSGSVAELGERTGTHDLDDAFLRLVEGGAG
jgi:ABC-2 type transport system ATP-binding protein